MPARRRAQRTPSPPKKRDDSVNHLAFWLAPMTASLPLIPAFSFRPSPLFLGTLMADPNHPFLWPWLGPCIVAVAIFFDATLLAYVFSGPLYFLVLRGNRKLPTLQVLIFFSLTGILAALVVHEAATFRQPGLQHFALSWLSPVLGCLCGLVAGTAYIWLAKRDVSSALRPIAYSLPVVILAGCGLILIWSASAR